MANKKNISLFSKRFRNQPKLFLITTFIRLMGGLVSERVGERVDGDHYNYFSFIRGRILHSSTVRRLITTDCS